MNILVFNWQDIKNPLSGGAEVHLHEIFSRLAALGHHVTLFCSSYPGGKDEEIIEGIRVLRKGSRSTFNFWVPIEYLSRFRAQRFDIVVDDLNKIPFFTPLYVRQPLVGISHHFFGKSIFLETNFLVGVYVYLSEKMVKYIYRRIPFLVVSESTRNELIAMGFSPEKLAIARNCVDHTIYRRTGILKSDVPLVGYFGRIKKYKRIDHLLNAFSIVRKEIPHSELLIVGEGNDRPRLEKLAKRLGIHESVAFTGFVSPEEKIKRLQQMHVVVSTSAKEGWGLTVMEANACGTCVIASNVPGLRDSVMDNQTGLLYEFGNIEELAGKIIRVLRDHELRKRLSENAVTWAQKFQWEDSATKVLEHLTDWRMHR